MVSLLDLEVENYFVEIIKELRKNYQILPEWGKTTSRHNKIHLKYAR